VIVPVKRRISKMIDGRITPTTVAAYRHARKLRERGADPEEVHAAERVVDRALNIKLWQTSLFDVYTYRDDGAPDWEHAAELRRKLDAALAQATEATTGPEPEPAPA
jgi:hypothetical protein